MWEVESVPMSNVFAVGVSHISPKLRFRRNFIISFFIVEEIDLFHQ